MLLLTEEDEKRITLLPSSIMYIKLSCGEFFIEQKEEEEILSELFYQKVASIVGLKSNKYYFYKKKNYLLSQTDIEDNIKLFVGDEKNYNNTLDKIRFYIDYQKCNNNILINNEQLMLQVYIMHFLDILFSNHKRSCMSYCFSVNNDKTASLQLLSTGTILTDIDKAIRPISFINAKNVNYSKTEELSNFISIIDEEVKKAVKDIYNLFTPKKFIEIINSIEKEEDIKFICKKSMYYKYLKNYTKIGIVLFMKKIITKKKTLKL